MDNNYFENLANSLKEKELAANTSSVGAATAYLTVKVDIDCKLFCDGDFLDFFEANKVKKNAVQTGWHLFTIESAQFSEVSEDYEIDVAEAGKNYPLLVKGLKQKEDRMIQNAEEEKRKAEEEAKRKAEIEAKRKAEEEARQKAEEEAKRKAEEEEARHKAEEEEKRKTEEENQRLVQEASKNDIVFKINICLSHEKLHETLVNLFSTALTGSEMLGCDYDEDFWGLLPEEKRQGEYFEDKIVDTLINGGKVCLYDYYAEGELHGEKGEIVPEEGSGKYTITLKDVIDGLQRAADGSFKIDNDWEKKEAREAFLLLIEGDECDEFDRDKAENLVQIIIFNEVIYANVGLTEADLGLWLNGKKVESYSQQTR